MDAELVADKIYVVALVLQGNQLLAQFIPLRLPMPEPLYDEDDRLPATYANFLILNGAVIVPTYSQEANDAKALSLVADAFPGYDIIGVDSRTIVRQHGSIHCLTMQYPEGVR